MMRRRLIKPIELESSISIIIILIGFTLAVPLWFTNIPIMCGQYQLICSGAHRRNYPHIISNLLIYLCNDSCGYYSQRRRLFSQEHHKKTTCIPSYHYDFFDICLGETREEWSKGLVYGENYLSGGLIDISFTSCSLHCFF